MGIIAGMNLGSALGQTMFGSGAQSFNDANRVPMSFTSTRRLRILDPNFTSISQVLTGETILSTEGALAAAVGQQYSTFQKQKSSPINGTMVMIDMMVNPNTITWKQPKRIVKRDTQEGSIFFHFSNSKGQNNDILTMEFRGNTGNINVRGDIDTNYGALSTIKSINTGATKKLLIWHNLWQLTREPMLLEDNTINEFMIYYNSPVIPTGITLIGFFSAVLDWTDSADKPFSKDYGFSFTIQDTMPPLDDLLQEINTVVIDPSQAVQDLTVK